MADPKMQQPQPQPAQPPAAGKLNVEMIRSKMQVPPNLQSAYDRVITAGKKIMYSQQMAPQITELLKGQGTPGQKIGQGIVALMAIMIGQSNHTMPPQLVIPAATELVVVFADFLRESGLKVEDKDIGEGMATMISTIMERAGITPDKLQGILQQGGGGGGAAPATPAQPAPAPGGNPAPEPAGLVGGAMTKGQ